MKKTPTKKVSPTKSTKPEAPLTEEALRQKLAQLEEENKNLKQTCLNLHKHIQFMRNTMSKLVGISTAIIGE